MLRQSHDLKPWRETMWCVAKLDEGCIERVEEVPDNTLQPWVPYGQTYAQCKAAYTSPDNNTSHVVARLPRGANAAAEVAPASALQYRIHLVNPNLPVAEDVWRRPMLDDLVHSSLLVLLGAVGCVLLIACLNASNLLVARGAAASTRSRLGDHFET